MTIEEPDVKVYQLFDINDVFELKNNIPYFENMETSFFDLSKQFSFPVSIVHETYYVDRTFRDSYYTYFASKHFTVEKNCQRIAIFETCFDIKDFYDQSKHSMIQNHFIGTIVIKPLIEGTWGRTLIDPSKLNKKPFFVRTTLYDVIINGVNLQIHAYPFSSQDTETMTCAETSIWTMLDYYGTRYPEYRTVQPSDIISEVNLSSDERVLPSHGLSYLQKSNLLKKFGFSPRVYEREKYGDTLTKKIFHYYVESGIPVTISLNGHSTVCIGHSDFETNIQSVNAEYNIDGINFYDSSDFCSDYVIIDDNQIPYVIETYDHFSVHQNSKQLVRFTVPLYKRIFLEASDAKGIFDVTVENLFNIPHIKAHVSSFGVNTNNSIIKRMFLTSSRKFKSFRIANAYSVNESQYYSKLPFPKFVWVLELSSVLNYKTECLGEIVLDATSGRFSGLNSIILIRIGNYFAYRMPYEMLDDLLYRLMYTIDIGENIKQYVNNLCLGGKK